MLVPLSKSPFCESTWLKKIKKLLACALNENEIGQTESQWGVLKMETDSEDEDQEPKTAFDEILAKEKTFKRKVSEVEEEDEDGPHDPGGAYWGVAYLRTLRWPVDPDNPLIGNAYVGQAVRAIGKKYPTALAAATARWKTEDRAAARGEGSDVCLLELLRIHGPKAFENTVVSERHGPKLNMKEWADGYEKAEIASRGGPMRDMAPNVHIRQTLNRTSGGQGAPTINWDAVSAKAWAKFRAELELYVAATGNALVPSIYVAPSGYKLGQCVSGKRNGRAVDGHPERREWLDSLPGWSWNTYDHQWAKFKKALETYVSERDTALVPRPFIAQCGYPLGQTVKDARQGQMVKDQPERREWLSSLTGWSWNLRPNRRISDTPWEDFVREMQAYVSEHGTALVPQTFIAKSGYRLGPTVNSVRGGGMRKGKPERDVWLDSLPGWAWTAREATRAVRLALARSSALPYEPIKSKRVAGSFYLGKPGSDDMILRAKTDLQYKKICPRVPPS